MSKKVDFFLSLNALLGVYGVKTSMLQTNQDYWKAATALWPDKLSAGSLEDLQRQIKAMSKAERKSIAISNIHRLPDQWRSTAEKHERRYEKARQAEAAE